LETVKPESSRHFVALAAEQVRRELIDLGRHFFGPEGMAAHHVTPPPNRAGENTPVGNEPPQTTHDPAALAVWTEFHEQVQGLPDEEREVFEQTWYLGLAQTEIAEALGVDRSTVIRRLQRAKRTLFRESQKHSFKPL